MEESYFYKLDNTGKVWVRECLENGEAFSKVVLSIVNLEKGSAYVAVAIPEHQKAVKDHRPLRWGALPLGVINTKAQTNMLFHALKQLEEEHGPLTVVSEDNLWYPNDKAPKTLQSPTGELYQFKNRYLYSQNLSKILSPTDLTSSLQGSWLLNAFLILEENMPHNKNLTDQDAQRLASSVLGIINFAYDGETYTLWTSNHLRMPIQKQLS